MSLNFKKILSKIDYPADWVGIRYVEEIQNSLSTNNADVDNIKRNCTCCCFNSIGAAYNKNL